MIDRCSECGTALRDNATRCSCGQAIRATKVLNHLTISSLLKSQAEYYGRKLSDEAIAIYERDLREFRYREIEEALDQLRNAGANRMPLATDIRHKIRESQPQSSVADVVNEREVEICSVMTEMWFAHKQGLELEAVFSGYASSMQFYGITRERCEAYFGHRENILKITGQLTPWSNFRYAEGRQTGLVPEDEKFNLLSDFFGNSASARQ